MTTKSIFCRSTPSAFTLCSKILTCLPVSNRMRLPRFVQGPAKPRLGFSGPCRIDGKRILFDTGNNVRIFEHNVKALGVDLQKIDFVVISHRQPTTQAASRTY